MKASKGNRRKKRAGVEFEPSHEDLQSAINDYLTKGGKIKKLESLPEDMERLSQPSYSSSGLVDQFLLGK